MNGQRAGPSSRAWPCALTETLLANRNENEDERNESMTIKSAKDNNRAKINRTTQFAFQAPAARQVSLVGDFNNWDTKAGPMRKGPDGVWHLSVGLKPGCHEYRFLADEVWCDDPAARQRVANSLGTENCVRMVAP